MHKRNQQNLSDQFTASGHKQTEQNVTIQRCATDAVELHRVEGFANTFESFVGVLKASDIDEMLLQVIERLFKNRNEKFLKFIGRQSIKYNGSLKSL